MGGGAAFRNMIYNTFFRRTSVYAATMAVAAMVTTDAYFKATDSIWKSINKGVRSLFLVCDIGALTFAMAMRDRNLGRRFFPLSRRKKTMTISSVR